MEGDKSGVKGVKGVKWSSDKCVVGVFMLISHKKKTTSNLAIWNSFSSPFK